MPNNRNAFLAAAFALSVFLLSGCGPTATNTECVRANNQNSMQCSSLRLFAEDNQIFYLSDDGY